MEWVDPQTGKKWRRVGECTHCGNCCSTFCPHLRIKALRDIKAGESFHGVGENKGNIIMTCDVFDQDVTVDTGCIRGCTLKVRKEFPSSPLSTPCECGFYWVDEDGNRWIKPDYSMGVLKET